MGGNKSAIRDLEQTSQMESRLFREYANVGIPALKSTQGYIRGALDVGEPGYVKEAYNAARVSATEGVQGQLQRALGGTEGLSGGAFLKGVQQSYAAGGAALAGEKQAINVKEALGNIERRNMLMSALAGSGGQATNLSQGLGDITTRGLGIQGFDDPRYEGVLGLASAGAYAYMNLNKPSTGSTLTAAPPPGYGLAFGGH